MNPVNSVKLGVDHPPIPPVEAGPLRVSDLLTYLLVNCIPLCILQSVVNAQKTSVPGSTIAVNGATERVCDLVYYSS